MPALATELRNKLERTVIEARDVAEAGARAALEALAVDHHEPYQHQTPEQRKLRNHLRARARQVGETQTAKGGLSIDHLVHECAYEHWHRMLFARFLAENDLLIEPSAGVAISLQECKELAKEAKTDLWTYASRCAEQMLPQIFRPDDPLVQVTLAREHRVKLEHLLADLGQTVFKADDSLGWVYQFWQSKKKDQVNASGEKITGDTLPAVTQLFTDHYMVLFLLHNTIGAWRAGKVLAANPKLAESAGTEQELRQVAALSAAGGYSFDYLRFVRGSDGKRGPWRAAAGTFDGWPKRAGEIKLLDPCCGSGHFLVAAFDLLVRLRMHEEGLLLPNAVDAVIRDNVFGLELDTRCTQIAAFNLALAAWRLSGFRRLPPLNVACGGLSVGGKKDEWVALAGGDHKLRGGMEHLYEVFKKGPELGSLIDPRRAFGQFPIASWSELEPLLATVLAKEATRSNPYASEIAIAAQGLSRAAVMLSDTYTLVITNVPYLGRGDHGPALTAFADEFEPEAKADLATMFVSRSMPWLGRGGSLAVVTPQNWLFLASYRKLRRRLLRERSWDCVVRLGEHAFESSAAAGAFAAMLVISAGSPPPSHRMCGIDVSAPRGKPPIYADQKARMLRGELPVEVRTLLQTDQARNPDSRVLLMELDEAVPLANVAVVSEGLHTGDYPRFGRKHWEVPPPWKDWSLQQGGTEDSTGSGGCEHILFWQNGAGELVAFVQERLAGQALSMWIKGEEVWGKRGLAVGAMSELKHAPYFGALFTHGIVAIVPRSESDLSALACYVESAEFRVNVRLLDQKVCVARASFEQVPFDQERWGREASRKYPNGLPDPESDDPTQWLFHGRPEQSTVPLEVAVARLVGYRWPAELDGSLRLSARARELTKRSQELLKYADEDGIVCIPSVRGEEPAADRLLALLTNCGIKPGRDLDDWLRNSFFEEHCKLFHHRPFIWHIWDGRKRDGFHALVNYHRLAEGGGRGRKLLESLTYSHLGEWITRQQDSVRQGEDGAEDRLAAATELQKRLIAILEGEPPFDIFVRWKPLHAQPMGWEPDINDGVRINIRPFMVSDLPNGRAGAGILRWKPNIKWEKDRGKEPDRPKAVFPWFWGWDGKTVEFMGGKEFTGERFNDCHYTVAAKQRARDAAGKSKEKARR